MDNRESLYKKSCIEDITENVNKFYNKRKVILWGKCETSDLIRKKLKEKYNIEIAFYVDKDNEKIDNRFVFPISSIYGKSKEYYIVVPLGFDKSVKMNLRGGGGYDHCIEYCNFNV